jgi:hypothetical protein
MSTVGVDIESELGGDDHLSAERLKGFSDELFVVERAVDLSRIEKGDATLDGGMDKSDRVLLLREWLIGKGHSHAAEPESRYFKIAVS